MMSIIQLLFPDIVLFPYFLYPVNQVAVSGSIFMTVAIAWERYVAVHYPIDYNQAKHELRQFLRVRVRGRTFIYMLPHALCTSQVISVHLQQ
jgi:hypothetical protein